MDVTLELLPYPTSQDQRFALTSHLGAAIEVSANNYAALWWEADIQRAPGMRKVRRATLEKAAAS